MTEKSINSCISIYVIQIEIDMRRNETKRNRDTSKTIVLYEKANRLSDISSTRITDDCSENKQCILDTIIILQHMKKSQKTTIEW